MKKTVKKVISVFNNKKILGIISLFAFCFVLIFNTFEIFAASTSSATIKNVPYTLYFKTAGKYSPNDHGYVYYGSFPQTEITNTTTINSIKTACSVSSPTNGTVYTNPTNGERYLYEIDSKSTGHWFKFEPIKWEILDIDNTSGSEKLLLLSESVIDRKRRYTQRYCGMLWDASTSSGSLYKTDDQGRYPYPTLRLYLNSYDTTTTNYTTSGSVTSYSKLTYTKHSNWTFYEKGFAEKAFSGEEYKYIIAGDNSFRSGNSSYGYDGTARECKDKVRLPSAFEISGRSSSTGTVVSGNKATQYGFEVDGFVAGVTTNRVAVATDYCTINCSAVATEYPGSDTTGGKKICSYWLRTSTADNNSAVVWGDNVNKNDAGKISKSFNDNANGIRPMITLDLAKLKKIKGTGSLSDPYVFGAKVTSKSEELGSSTGSSADYTLGSNVKISATVKTGNTFLGWYDDDGKLVSSSNPYSFEMPPNDLNLTAKISVSNTGVLNASNGSASVIKEMLTNATYLAAIDSSDATSNISSIVSELDDDELTALANKLYKRNQTASFTDVKDVKKDIRIFGEGITLSGEGDGSTKTISISEYDSKLTFTLQKYNDPSWEDSKNLTSATDSVTFSGAEGKYRVIVKAGTETLVTSNELTLKNIYRLTYNYMGGTGTPEYVDLIPDDAFGTLPSATKTGYELDGWFEEDTFLNEVNASDIISSNTEIFAKWTPITFAVKFNGNGSTSGSIEDQTFTYDATNTLSKNTFERKYTVNFDTDEGTVTNSSLEADYSFAGWTLNEDGTGTVYEDEGDVTDNFTTEKDATVNLYAKWTSNSVTLESATKKGYTFDGWYLEDTLQNLVGMQGASFTPDSDVALYAKWNANTYESKLTYNANGGTGAPTNETYTVTYPDTKHEFTVSDVIPTREGYTFEGWYKESDLINEAGAKVEVGIDNEDDNQSLELFAKWSLIDYEININLDGGETEEPNPLSYTIASNQITLINPSKPGYTFTGWTGTDLDGKVTTVTIPQGSIGNRSYTANYEIITYTIEYVLNSGLVDGTNETSYDVVTESFTLINPSKTGYEFDGWTWEGETTPQTTVTIEKGTTGNKKFTANFSTISYTLLYELDGGEASPANKAEYDIETDTFTLVSPNKEGYTFTGWTGTNLTDKTSTVTIPQGSTGNRSYTANYEIITYTIEYILNSGLVDGTNETSYDVETTSFTLINPSKTGYEFDGWTWEGETTPQTTVTIEKGTIGNKKFTANFSKIGYTISYELDGGEVTPANKVEYDIETDTFTLVNPTKEGYTFAGWTGTDLTDKTATVTIEKGSTGNKEFVANYNPITYTITYTLNSGTLQNANLESYNIETETFTLNNPVKKGYTFTGWTWTGHTDKETSVTIEKGTTGDKEYVANFEKDTYTVEYDLDGGTLDVSNPSSYDVDTETFTLNNPERIGYTFFGWTRTGHETPEMEAKIEKGSAGNLTVKANWIARTDTPYVVNHYKVNEDKTTYSLADTENKEGITDSTLNLASLQKSYDGFTFEGGKAEDATEIKPQSFDIETTILADGTRVINLYYKIRERSSGGGGGGGASKPTSNVDFKISTGDSALDKKLLKDNEKELSKVKIENGMIISLPENLEWEGHTFDGWYKDKDFKEKVKVGDSIEGKITLYAKFSEKKSSSLLKAYMKGYEDGTFGPNLNMTRAEAATIIARISEDFSEDQDFTSKSKGYKDYKKTHWANNYIGFVTEKEIMQGDEKGFRPDDSITRGEFSKLIYKLLDLENANLAITKTFTDCKGQFYETYANALYSKGILTGYEDGTFKGKEKITRTEAAIMINKATGRGLDKDKTLKAIKESKDFKEFKDVPSNRWFYLDDMMATVSYSLEEEDESPLIADKK